MNRCVLIGRLVKEPEARVTQSGTAVTTFTLAVGRRFKKEETDYLSIVTWKGLAESCAKHLVKGQRAAVSGEIQTRSYETQDGTRKYVTEVIADEVEFLDKPGGARQETELGEIMEDEGLPF